MESLPHTTPTIASACSGTSTLGSSWLHLCRLAQASCGQHPLSQAIGIQADRAIGQHDGCRGCAAVCLQLRHEAGHGPGVTNNPMQLAPSGIRDRSCHRARAGCSSGPASAFQAPQDVHASQTLSTSQGPPGCSTTVRLGPLPRCRSQVRGSTCHGSDPLSSLCMRLHGMHCRARHPKRLQDAGADQVLPGGPTAGATASPNSA